MQFSVFEESRRGARKLNQDRTACCQCGDALLMLVADGMGGHLHGELAAQTAAQCISAAFRREAQPRLADPGAFLRRALSAAHQTLIELATAQALAEVPRTTCVACIVQDDSACWAHAGDSRLYHIRAGIVRAQTRDHTLVQELIARGRMREEALAAHPDRNRIYSCLGANQPPRIDVSAPAALEPGDVLLLCSDGFWGPLLGKAIAAALLTQGMLRAIPALLDLAESRAGHSCDNLSVVALSWQEPSPGAGSGQAAQTPSAQAHAPEPMHYLSDEEIDLAIDRLRAQFKETKGG